jgi:hypothetical protein
MQLISNLFCKAQWRAAMGALVVFGTLSSASAQEQQNRTFPADSYQVMVDAIAPPIITIDGTTVQIAAGSLIFTGDGRTITSGNLGAGILVRVEFNSQCQLKKIWVLNGDEIIPRPWWMRFYQPSFVPPC